MSVSENKEQHFPNSTEKRPEQQDMQRIAKGAATEAQKNHRDGDPAPTQKSAQPSPEAMAPQGTPAQTKPSALRNDGMDESANRGLAGPKAGDEGPDSHRK